MPRQANIRKNIHPKNQTILTQEQEFRNIEQPARLGATEISPALTAGKTSNSNRAL